MAQALVAGGLPAGTAFVTLPTSQGTTLLRGTQSSATAAEKSPAGFGSGTTAAAATAVMAVGFAVSRRSSLASRRCYLKPARGENVNQGYPVKGEEWLFEFAEVEEGKKYQNAFDDFNPNYPLSSPDQPRTEVTTKDIPRPEDIVDTSAFPMFSGSTNGYMSSSTRERHAITWTGKEEAMFEMPTKGMAIMNKGKNLCYFRRKEQCIALCKQLRNMKIQDVKIYRVAKDSKVTLLHPSDGVYPEKVNKGRVPVNFRPFTARGEVPNFAIRDSEYFGKPYEADPLTIMFSKARWYAMGDRTNLFPMPNPKLTSGPVDANYPNVVDYNKLIEEAKADQAERIQKAIADISSTGKSL